MSISLPEDFWFVQNGEITGNVFSGSVGTDPMKGCISETTFNYKVSVEEKDTKFIVIASCYIQLPFNKGSEKINIEQQTFDLKKNGLSCAQKWLESKISEFDVNSR